MHEFELIERLRPLLPRHPSLVQGAGDDCAVIDAGIPGFHLLFKTDAVVEGFHFDRETDPHRVGHKALARCLSDIAAMGGEPISALVTLALPAHFDAEYVARLYDGMGALASKHQVSIAGGETTTNPERLILSISMIGRVPAGRALLRSGARPGDALFVTGELGGSRAGKHLDFEPRLEQAQWLSKHFEIHAMIDLSDGLAGDVRHLLRESGVGAELLDRAIPVSLEARRTERQQGGKTALASALTDGEDFELLFCVPPGRAVALKDAWREAFPSIRLSCIGKITEARGLRICIRGELRAVLEHGYTHFAKP